MFPSLCILGRQPALGLAELESLFDAKAVKPVGERAALLDSEPSKVPFAYLGGTMKFCKVLTVLETTGWSEIQKFLANAVPEHAARLPEGKMKLGLSVYGLEMSPSQINATALGLKKIIRASGRSVRVVPNNEPALNSAQVLHNQLTSPLGWELILVRDRGRTILAQTIAVQDIEAYSRRDRNRPKRDMRVGMLPPKLAQIIINMASGSVTDPSCGPTKPNGKTLLDPFCGTGVVLQEALLMGYDIYGTDIDERMIDFSRTNLKWLSANYNLKPNTYNLEAVDATKHRWNSHFDTLASETYLGRAFNTPPTSDKLAENVQTTNTIIKKFLHNLASQTQPGFRLCLAVPAWHVRDGFKHLPILDAFDHSSASTSSSLSLRAEGLSPSAEGRGVERVDQLTDMGYNRVSFVHAGEKDLIYYRPGQFVGRELVVLTRS